jgi:hypothetical protein
VSAPYAGPIEGAGDLRSNSESADGRRAVGQHLPRRAFTPASATID